MKKIMVVVMLSLVCVSCDRSSHQNTTQKTYTLHATPLHKSLYFTGTLQPLSETTLISPADAILESMHYQYGQRVTKDAVILTLNSAQLQQQYNETLTDYLKAKDSYRIAKAKFSGTSDLWEAGLIPKNTYLSEKSNLNTGQVTLMQATRKLSEMLKKMGDVSDEPLTSLSFSEFDKVRLALTGQHNLIRLSAQNDGILLYPPKSGDDKNQRLQVGVAVKAGQALALVGDLRGIRVEIDIPEVDIIDIKQGMPATIKGLAFGDEPLHGQLAFVNAQASMTNGAGLPSFSAVVEVKTLTPSQQKLVKVGMSASVELTATSINKLMIPISAVEQRAGQSFVKKRDASGKISLHRVVTDEVHEDQVVIKSGLAEGDVIVL
jgi:HlyD family secretion protein